MVLLLLLVAWQCIAYEVGRVVAAAMTGDTGPIENEPNALSHPSRSLRLGKPDRREHLKDLGRADVRHQLFADERKGKVVQRVDPLLDVLAVAPSGPTLGIDCIGGSLKRRHIVR